MSCRASGGLGAFIFFHGLLLRFIGGSEKTPMRRVCLYMESKFLCMVVEIPLLSIEIFVSQGIFQSLLYESGRKPTSTALRSSSCSLRRTRSVTPIHGLSLSGIFERRNQSR